MKIIVNSKEHDTKAGNITDLVKELNIPENGIAIASNNTMISRSNWDSTPVTEGMNLIIIKAACGG